MENETPENLHEECENGARERKAGAIMSPGACIFGVLLLLFALYLPFVNKAFHIDDNVYVDLSRLLGWNPLHAIQSDYNYNGTIIPLLPYDATHPILIPYVIKVVTALFGVREVPLHLVFMIFPVIALFSLMKLNAIFFPHSRRTTALLLAVFLCSMPAFLVNAQNIMTDVPTFAFLLLAMTGFFSGFENGSRRMTYLGGIALTLAIFTSYQMLAFVPLIFLYAVWRRKLTVHVTLSLAIPLLAVLSWLVAVYAVYDIFPFFKSKVASAKTSIADEVRKGLVMQAFIRKVFSIFAFLGEAMILIIPLHYALKKALPRFFLLFVPLVIVCYGLTFKITGFEFGNNLIFSSLVALGLLTCVTLGQSVLQKMVARVGAEREIFLLVWFFCVIGYLIALFPFGAARYLLPAFPPALLLLMNDPAWSFATRARRIALACVVSGALLFAVASAYSDYAFADTYRDFARKTGEARARLGNSANVWYIGQWGMQYYMDRAGAKYLHADSAEPMPGDYVIVPEMCRIWEPSLQVQERLAMVAQQPYSSRLPLRLFNRRSHAGFYSDGWGMLPFAFSTEPDEVFYVFKVVR